MTAVFVAALTGATALTAAPHHPLIDLFRKLLKQDNPFAAAPRIFERALSASASPDGVWRRYDGDGCFVELGPFAGRTPQKMLIVARFPERAAAVAYAGQVSAALPAAPHPRLPIEIDGPFSYRGAIVIGRRPIGLEVDLAESETEWRVTVTLIAGGPRMVVPIGRAGATRRGGGSAQ